MKNKLLCATVIFTMICMIWSCKSAKKENYNTPGIDTIGISLNIDTITPEGETKDSIQEEDIWVDRWGQTNDTIIIGSALLYYPYGSFYDIESLEKSRYFQNKGQYQEKLLKDNSFEIGYSIGTTKILFYGVINDMEAGGDTWPIEIEYLDIYNNEMIWYPNIRIGMSIDDFTDLVLPNESISYPVSTYILWDEVNPEIKEILSFRNDTLANIKILTYSKPNASFPYCEYLDGDYIRPADLVEKER